MDWLQLDQRICVATGGAKGLGLGIVQALLASGCRVTVLDHDSDALAQLAATHPNAQRLLPIQADVSSPAAVEAAFQTLQQHWGAGPSVLVNNAAITSAAPLAELDPAVWERQLQINLGGYLRMGQAFYRHSDASLPRAIVNIASISAQNAQPLSGGYSMSKNVLTISSRRDSGFAGWDARRNTAAIAALLRGFATTQTARKTTVPKGWSEIGRFLRAGPCLHPGASCGPSLRTHPDCTPTRLRRDRNHVLGPPSAC